ncbi:hypothetical protein TIFTF001_020464 [Ficus carica]|uniref:Uncharacterized protein n=1 Tax=Ficus carica TaxID=3494 RepID=A0AA88AIH2_FICCA|nr:hypothetical protein TIFTF001_020464 [Ficus carica]
MPLLSASAITAVPRSPANLLARLWPICRRFLEYCICRQGKTLIGLDGVAKEDDSFLVSSFVHPRPGLATEETGLKAHLFLAISREVDLMLTPPRLTRPDNKEGT